MPFDPCGTRTLDGEEILRRIAIYLKIPVEKLKKDLTEPGNPGIL